MRGSPVRVDLLVEATLMVWVLDFSGVAVPATDGAFATSGFDGNEPTESILQGKF